MWEIPKFDKKGVKNGSNFGSKNHSGLPMFSLVRHLAPKKWGPAVVCLRTPVTPASSGWSKIASAPCNAIRTYLRQTMGKKQATVKTLNSLGVSKGMFLYHRIIKLKNRNDMGLYGERKLGLARDQETQPPGTL